MLVWEISHAFCNLCIDASLDLLLCTLLVVEEIRPETRPGSVLSCVSVMESAFLKQCGSIRKNDRKANNLKSRWRYWPNVTTSQSKQSPNLSINIRLARFQALFVLFQKCDESVILLGLLVLCSVRILLIFITNSNWFVPKMWCCSSKYGNNQERVYPVVK